MPLKSGCRHLARQVEYSCRMGGRKRGSSTITEEVDFGTAELVPDHDRPGGWTLLLDGRPMSHVDTVNPARLEFGYMRRLASVVDAAAPKGEPVRVVHLGGGALSLPRYIAATRPGSRQLVIEHDAALVALVRRVLPPPPGVRIRVADATQVTGLSGYQIMLVDIPVDVPMIGVARTVAANITDGSARVRAKALRNAGVDVCLMAESTVLNGRHAGNVVLAASPAGLPVARLSEAAAREVFPTKVLHGDVLDRYIGVKHSYA
jgi:hypothetical protein